jgi:hypothetical protein
MSLFRPSVPRIPRDESTPTGEVSLQHLVLELGLICTRNVKTVVGVTMLARWSLASHAKMPIMAPVLIPL